MTVDPEARARLDQLAAGCRDAIDRRFATPATAPAAAQSAAVERLHSDVVAALEAVGHTDPTAVAVGFGLAIETLLEPRTELPSDWPATA